MGKGNFILGTGSSSIGDVTFARRNGQQVARVRVRKIKNPRSYGQALQRMIASAVVRFYSALSYVLETSFEGLGKADSYSKFLSVNMNLMRANGYAVKKGSRFVPLPFVVSDGSLQRIQCEFQGVFVGTTAVSAATIGAYSERIRSLYPSIQEGDQITIVQVAKDVTGSYNTYYNRFFIDSTSEVTLAAAGLTTRGVDSNLGVVFSDVYTLVASFAIVSRWGGDAWLRSPANMAVSSDELANYTGDVNLESAIASYMNGGGSIPVSDIYLNGQDPE